MQTGRYNKPVLFLIFSRPISTNRVFEKIRELKPEKLYISADGPRNDNEKELTNETRKITEKIDWDCDLNTLFRENNLGCKLAVSSAIDWFFEHEEMGIILEDDVLPEKCFFEFCSELLDKYKDSEDIMQISGYNPLLKTTVADSYYFSKYGPIWGWASWRRAWKHYDVNIAKWPYYKENKLYKNFCGSIDEENWRIQLFDKIYYKEIDTWDFQWAFSKLIVGGLNISPAVNLVNNIGFDSDATHTVIPHYISIKTFNLSFPLLHPDEIARNKSLDTNYFEKHIKKTLLKKIRYLLVLAKTLGINSINFLLSRGNS